MPTWIKQWMRFLPYSFLVTLVLIILVAFLVPPERELGTKLSIVLVHGAWVWVGLIAFGAAALAGLAGLLLRRPSWHNLSLALGRTGLVFWLTYLPMSLYVMTITWGAPYFDEPRWRIPMMFGVVGLLLQIGLTLVNMPVLASAANLVFGVTLWVFLGSAANVLHPDSPIGGSGSAVIPAFFLTLLVLTMLLGVQIALWWLQRTLNNRTRPHEHQSCG